MLEPLFPRSQDCLSTVVSEAKWAAKACGLVSVERDNSMVFLEPFVSKQDALVGMIEPDGTFVSADGQTSSVVLPDNIAAFKEGAANTNEKPVYIGKLMLFSDQDLTALKHNLVFTAVVSTVFAGMISVISNPQIPLIWRSILLGSILTGLHMVCIATWNLIQSTIQVHPKCGPMAIWHMLTANVWRTITVTLLVVWVVNTFGPAVFDSFVHSCHLMGIF